MTNFFSHTIYKEEITLEEVQDLVNRLVTLIADYSNIHYRGYFYGFYDTAIAERKFYEAYVYLDNMIRLRNRLYMNLPNCCVCDYGKMIETVRSVVGSCSSERLDLVIEEDNYVEWALDNPERIPREVWEECLYTKCDISYDLIRSFNEDQLKCDIIYDVVKSLNNCKLLFDINKKESDCSIEYDILSKTTNCGLTYDQYKEIHICGGSFDLIKNITNCGAEIKANLAKKCLEINYNLKKYSIPCYE